ncbi:hypothetical protein TrRE_jg7988 [Triparma retinervis]|uniref:J domain-containing protein n=1 Tax=Triparma retinervis TaxID=2557542 RepID=A0A9W7FWS4_9STRA|nr:hypothetical protein TrRE_jg7988 [Triparma retinervis]
MLYDSLSEAIEHVTFPSPSSSSSSSSPLLLQSAWAKQALTGVSETYVTVEDDEGEDAVRSFFEEGRDWREGEMERMEIELEEWKSQINSASYVDSQVSDALAYFDIASSTSSSSPITPSVIKQKFNALAKLHHPDKGGNTSDFLTLRKHLKTLIERYHHD